MITYRQILKNERKIKLTNLNKLAGKMRENKITQENLSKLLNITQATVSARMTGKRSFKLNEAEIISKFLNLSENEKKEIFF